MQETTAARQFFALLHSGETIQMHHKTEVINQQRVKTVKNTNSSIYTTTWEISLIWLA